MYVLIYYEDCPSKVNKWLWSTKLEPEVRTLRLFSGKAFATYKINKLAKDILKRLLWTLCKGYRMSSRRNHNVVIKVD